MLSPAQLIMNAWTSTLRVARVVQVWRSDGAGDRGRCLVIRVRASCSYKITQSSKRPATFRRGDCLHGLMFDPEQVLLPLFPVLQRNTLSADASA